MVSPTATICEVVRLLWGDSWPSGMSRATGINVRTLQRIRAAGDAGGDGPGAVGALLALRATVEAVRGILDRGQDWP